MPPAATCKRYGVAVNCYCVGERTDNVISVESCFFKKGSRPFRLETELIWHILAII